MAWTSKLLMNGHVELIQVIDLLFCHHIGFLHTSSLILFDWLIIICRNCEIWLSTIALEIGETRLKLWIRFRFTYGRRREGPDQPAPPLPSKVASTDLTVLQGNPKAQQPQSQESFTPTKYPYITIFKTAEEALRNVDRRRAANPPYPESDVEKAWKLKQVEGQTQFTTEQATEWASY